MTSKFRTALGLLSSGSFARFGQRIRINIRARTLARAQGQPFVYQLDGTPFVCMPGMPDSEDLFLSGQFDRFELDVLRHWLQPRDAFIDCGAHLGLYTFFAHHALHGSGNILAVEAAPELAQNLETAARLLAARNVTIESTVIGDRVGTVTFYAATNGQATTEQSLSPNPECSAAYAPIDRPMSSLAMLCEKHPSITHPAAVKLDVEGAEPLALRGTPPAWFTREGPLWMVEINPPALRRFGSTPTEITNRFPSLEFDLWLAPQFAGNGRRCLPVRRLAAGESFADALFYNLIAIPRSDRFADRRNRLARLIEP